MNTLQNALKANALFSCISGILLIVLQKPLAALFGTDNTIIFWVIGVSLLYFTATIAYEIRKQRKIAVLWIITQDILWVVGSSIILIFRPFDVSVIGQLIIGTVAIIVLLMAINQTKALKK